jgi:hypothetical protein
MDTPLGWEFKSHSYWRDDFVDLEGSVSVTKLVLEWTVYESAPELTWVPLCLLFASYLLPLLFAIASDPCMAQGM